VASEVFEVYGLGSIDKNNSSMNILDNAYSPLNWKLG
jgi:hypothetical protein